MLGLGVGVGLGLGVQLSHGDAPIDGSLSSFGVTPFEFDANGVATTAVAATALGLGSTPLAGITFGLTVAPRLVSAASSTVGAAPATIADDGIETSTISIQLYNTAGRAVRGFAGSKIVITSTGSGNTIVQPTGYTDYAGRCSGTIASTDAGTKTITVTVSGLAITQTVNVEVSGTPAAGYSFLPAGATLISRVNNPSSYPPTGWYQEFNPNVFNAPIGTGTVTVASNVGTFSADQDTSISAADAITLRAPGTGTVTVSGNVGTFTVGQDGAISTGQTLYLNGTTYIVGARTSTFVWGLTGANITAAAFWLAAVTYTVGARTSAMIWACTGANVTNAIFWLEGGSKRIVSAGYSGTPAIGGANVVQHRIRRDGAGGYGASRLGYNSFGTVNRVFIGMERQWQANNGFSDQSMKFVFALWGDERIFISTLQAHPYTFGLSFGSSGWGARSGAEVWLTSPIPVAPNWPTIQWIMMKDTVNNTAGIIRIYIDNVLRYEATDVVFPAHALSDVYEDGTDNGIHKLCGPEARTIGRVVTSSPCVTVAADDTGWIADFSLYELAA